ncbi:MAG: hypothetical protein GY853_01375 [PVC group bacterium]|nr:hypothetical protein [PVC group bacterium]
MKFIFCSDLHLRYDRPICRTDEDWIETQEGQLQFIRNECLSKNCPVIIGGDVFHTPTVSDYIKNLFIRSFPLGAYAIAGQHDLPYHLWRNVDSSSYGVLLNSEVIKPPIQFGKYANYNEQMCGTDTGLYFFHRLVFINKSDMPPNVKATTAMDLLKEYPDAKWIFCGDNHHGFHFESGGRHVVMGGCMNRQASDMEDYQPVIWFIDTSEGKVEKIPVPDNVEIVENAKVKEREEIKNRIGAWMEVIKGSKPGEDGPANFDYKHNVETEMKQTTELTKGSKNIIRGYLDE